jgi:hypothetical protein
MAGGQWRFWACGEYCGVLPDGTVKPSDQSKHAHWRVDAGGRVELKAARNGWVSLRLVAAGSGEFAVRCELDGDGVACDLYREFYHKMAGEQDVWLPDALVPLAAGERVPLPHPEYQCPHQTAQSVWVDLFVARNAKVGPRAGRLVLAAGGAELAIELALDVLELTCPDDDAVCMDHNSYGCDWIAQAYGEQVPQARGPEQFAAMIPIIHAYHRMCFEHHGLLHQLGMGHSGVTNALFAPRLSGDGRGRHVSDWSTYDAHYGPLLDGSAFAGCRRRAAPVHAIYTAFNPDWPADYLGFRQPGYRVELQNVLRDFDEHFKANGWTKTILEYFFNHKKRYRYFEWDGDEPRYERDDETWKHYGEMFHEVTAGSPVQWRFRCDASWMQRYHWDTLAGVVNFWVCGGFVNFYEQEVHAGPMARGDEVWFYGGGATLPEASSGIIQAVYRAWFRDFKGFCRWLTTRIGPDPWMANDGMPTGMFHPGTRFGVAGPIASIRLKLERNAVQDVNLLEMIAAQRGKQKVRDDLTPKIPIRLWEPKPKGAVELPSWEWTAKNLQREIEPSEQKLEPLDPLWWQAVRDYAIAGAQEVYRG